MKLSQKCVRYLWICVTLVAISVGIFTLVWFVIKKKTWAEFLDIFKK